MKASFIDEVIDYIEMNLTEDLQLQELAEQFCYSPFYFHRMFTAATGMTLQKYVQGRRMACAAYELALERPRIIELALKYQYESQSSFTRSFKRVFGQTPKQFMERPIPVEFTGKMDVQERQHYLSGGKQMKPEIRELKKMTIIGLEASHLKTIGTAEERRKSTSHSGTVGCL